MIDPQKLLSTLSYMQPLDGIENSLLSNKFGKYPPVHKWNPPFSGDIAIVIKENGDWYHEDIKFTRQPLIKLFSSILKKEGEEYFLVTPVEKWKITVEDAPLLVVDLELVENTVDDHLQTVIFKTSTDDFFPLDSFHPLQFGKKNNNAAVKPYVLMRDNLEALIHRNVFYQLANMAQSVDGDFGVWSDGCFFKLQ